MAVKTIKNKVPSKISNLGLLAPDIGLQVLEEIVHLHSMPIDVVGYVPKSYWDLIGTYTGKLPRLLEFVVPKQRTGAAVALAKGPERLDRDQIKNTVIELVGNSLENAFSRDDPLELQGLNSLSGLELKSKLQEEFGSGTFAEVDLMESNIHDIVDAIFKSRKKDAGGWTEATDIKSSPPTISPSPIRIKLRIFCLPWAGGVSENLFSHWSMMLPACIQVCPVEIPGRGRRRTEKPVARVEDLAELLAMSLPVDDVPFAIFGTCLGAIIGYELIRSLERNGRRTPALFMPAAVSPPHVYASVVAKIYMQRRLRMFWP